MTERDRGELLQLAVCYEVRQFVDRTLSTPPICFSTWEQASRGFFVMAADFKKFLVFGNCRL